MEFDSKGLIATLVFHSLLLMFFIFAGFTTPLPLPAEEGMLINFGDTETGLGDEEPMPNNVSQPVQKEVSPEETVEKIKDQEPVMTQDYEDAPEAMVTKKEKKKVTEKKKEVPKKEVKKVEAKVQEPVEEKPVVNKQALYRGKKTGSESTGSEGVKEGKGNQGSLSGSENATNHSLGNSSGNGVSFSLAGRNPLLLPQPEFDHQKEGRVVVEVKVDQKGNVVSAVPGVKGSTTLDNYLCTVAKKAALASRFDSKSDAPATQVGTITYIFKLK